MQTVFFSETLKTY